MRSKLYREPIAKTWESIPLDNGHMLEYVEYGNPEGEPVLFLHGGPGQGAKDEKACFFDPEKYRIILFNQRGANKSDAQRPIDALLTANTTEHLLDDIGTLRETLGIEGKMHLFGSSWGSTLAMAYAATHPEQIQSLTLAGIYLGNQASDAFAYCGGNIDYFTNHTDIDVPAYFTEAWERFRSVMPDDLLQEPDRLMQHIYAKLNASNVDAEFIKAMFNWQSACYFMPNAEAPDISGEHLDDMGLQYARRSLLKEFHYHANGNFLPFSTEEMVARLPEVPTAIVHGQGDAICSVENAKWLREQLPHATLHLTSAGHSTSHEDSANALVTATNAAIRKPAIAPSEVQNGDGTRVR